jgi:methyl-accepting chemotaxis protein
MPLTKNSSSARVPESRKAASSASPAASTAASTADNEAARRRARSVAKQQQAAERIAGHDPAVRPDR